MFIDVSCSVDEGLLCVNRLFCVPYKLPSLQISYVTKNFGLPVQMLISWNLYFKMLHTLVMIRIYFFFSIANVTLDPNTAHPGLILSEAYKHVNYEHLYSHTSDGDSTACSMDKARRGSYEGYGAEKWRPGIRQYRSQVLPRAIQGGRESSLCHLTMCSDNGLLQKPVLGHYISSKPPFPNDSRKGQNLP